ncbi:hypothetical protein V6N11_050835 [Hibiscus sabdariffa]
MFLKKITAMSAEELRKKQCQKPRVFFTGFVKIVQDEDRHFSLLAALASSSLLATSWDLLASFTIEHCVHELNEIRDTNRNLVVIGKTNADNDNGADDDDADNAEESEGEEFEQETG